MAKNKGGAPLGNKNALGCTTSGRPSHFDKSVEAEELIKWANTEKALVLRMFAPIRGYSFDTMTRWAEEDLEFRQAYIRAKDIVGARRELVLIEKGCPSPFQRYATWYDTHLHSFERDEKTFDSKLKSYEEAKIPPNDLLVEKENKIMELKAKLAKLEKANNANKS
jgi:hypothetical protein